jgi:hypothetical protein
MLVYRIECRTANRLPSTLTSVSTPINYPPDPSQLIHLFGKTFFEIYHLNSINLQFRASSKSNSVASQLHQTTTFKQNAFLHRSSRLPPDRLSLHDGAAPLCAEPCDDAAARCAVECVLQAHGSDGHIVSTTPTTTLQTKLTWYPVSSPWLLSSWAGRLRLRRRSSTVCDFSRERGRGL